MKVLRALIAEDSQENIDTLSYLLRVHKNVLKISVVARTLEEAEQAFRANSCDIAFLDIQFKKGNIFTVLDTLVLEDIELPEIVFVTAHGSFEYATKAIQFACLDFVNKPIDANDLDSIISKIILKRKSGEDQRRQLEFLLKLLEGDMNAPTSLAIVKPKTVIEYIRLHDLCYILADKNTSIFFTKNDKIYSVKHLGYYIELLIGNSNFVQINRSCLVNTDHIKSYNPQTRRIQLDDDTELIVSHRYNKKFRHLIGQTKSKLIGNTVRRIKEIIFGE